MTEGDFEYLIRTLSDARSRATEITVAVRARAGLDDRLADLGHSAVSNIEKLLHDIRVLAVGEPSRPAPVKEAPAPRPAPPPSPTRFTAIAPSLESDHWVPAFVDDLIGRLRSPDGISFETAEHLLHDYRQQFLKDLETARRMYRTYPRLFEEGQSRRAGA